MAAATKQKKKSQNKGHTHFRRLVLRSWRANQVSLHKVYHVSKEGEEGREEEKGRWRVRVLEFMAGDAVFFIEMNGRGEALPERWVADACHPHALSCSVLCRVVHSCAESKWSANARSREVVVFMEVRLQIGYTKMESIGL